VSWLQGDLDHRKNGYETSNQKGARGTKGPAPLGVDFFRPCPEDAANFRECGPPIIAISASKNSSAAKGRHDAAAADFHEGLGYRPQPVSPGGILAPIMEFSSRMLSTADMRSGWHRDLHPGFRDGLRRRRSVTRRGQDVRIRTPRKARTTIAGQSDSI